jgi:hypothetical protein
MERSPARCGAPRSPWVIKKADISPLIAHELRRVERTLEHESLLLSRISHPNIVGFRAAQVKRIVSGLAASSMAAACASSILASSRAQSTCGPLAHARPADLDPPAVSSQRALNGQLCLALEACDCSLYSLIQERQFARIQIGEVNRGSPLFSSDEILSVSRTPLPPQRSLAHDFTLRSLITTAGVRWRTAL